MIIPTQIIIIGCFHTNFCILAGYIGLINIQVRLQLLDLSLSPESGYILDSGNSLGSDSNFDFEYIAPGQDYTTLHSAQRLHYLITYFVGMMLLH